MGYIKGSRPHLYSINRVYVNFVVEVLEKGMVLVYAIVCNISESTGIFEPGNVLYDEGYRLLLGVEWSCGLRKRCMYVFRDYGLGCVRMPTACWVISY